MIGKSIRFDQLLRQANGRNSTPASLTAAIKSDSLQKCTGYIKSPGAGRYVSQRDLTEEKATLFDIF